MSLNAKCVPVEFVGPTFLARPKLPFGEEVSPHREPGETHECGRQSCMQHFVCFVACVEWEFPASVWILVTGTRGVHLWLSCVQMIRNGNLHFVYLFRSCWL